MNFTLKEQANHHHEPQSELVNDATNDNEGEVEVPMQLEGIVLPVQNAIVENC